MIEQEDLRNILSLLSDYKGRVLGAIIGLVASLLIINFGVVLATFIMFCIGIGYYIGLRYDNREDFRDIVEDIFPPNE